MKLSREALEQKILSSVQSNGLRENDPQSLEILLNLIKSINLKEIIIFIQLLNTGKLDKLIQQKKKVLSCIEGIVKQNILVPTKAATLEEGLDELFQLLHYLNKRDFIKVSVLLKRSSTDKNFIEIFQILQEALKAYMEWVKSQSNLDPTNEEFYQNLQEIDWDSLSNLIDKCIQAFQVPSTQDLYLSKEIKEQLVISGILDLLDSLVIEDIPLLVDLLYALEVQSSQVLTQNFYRCVAKRGVLDLSGLKINDPDLKIILNLINLNDKHNTIQFISLSNNELENKAAELLSDCLIPALDLSNNHMNDFGIYALSSSTHLRALRMRKNPIMPKADSLIIKCLDRNFTQHTGNIFNSLMMNLRSSDNSYAFPSTLIELIFSYLSLDKHSTTKILDSCLYHGRNEISNAWHVLHQHNKAVTYSWQRYSYGLNSYAILYLLILFEFLSLCLLNSHTYHSSKFNQYHLAEGLPFLGMALISVWTLNFSRVHTFENNAEKIFMQDSEKGTLLPLIDFNTRLEELSKELEIKSNTPAPSSLPRNNSEVAITTEITPYNPNALQSQQGIYYLKNLSGTRINQANINNPNQSPTVSTASYPTSKYKQA